MGVKNFGKLFFSLLLVLQLFSCSKYNGFDEPITFPGHALSIRHVFGDDQKVYFIAELTWASNLDLYEYRLQEVTIDIDATGGYSWDWIGCDEEKHSQIYLISLTQNNFQNKRVKIRFSNIVSEKNKMLIINYDEWFFSDKIKFDKNEKRIIEIGENGVDRVEIYNNVCIFVPLIENGEVADIKNLNFGFEDHSGQKINPICASNERKNCYFSYVYFLIDSSSISSITINQNTYCLDQTEK